MDPVMSHPGLSSSPQLSCSWLAGWEQTLVARLRPASPGTPWSLLMALRQLLAQAVHQCRTPDAISGSELRDWEATKQSGHFHSTGLCQTSEAGWAYIKCPLRNGPWPSMPSRPPLVELAMDLQSQRQCLFFKKLDILEL